MTLLLTFLLLAPPATTRAAATTIPADVEATDARAALVLYAQAAAKGDDAAAFRMAELHANGGAGLKANARAAVPILQRLTRERHVGAQTLLAQLDAPKYLALARTLDADQVRAGPDGTALVGEADVGAGDTLKLRGAPDVAALRVDAKALDLKATKPGRAVRVAGVLAEGGAFRALAFAELPMTHKWTWKLDATTVQRGKLQDFPVRVAVENTGRQTIRAMRFEVTFPSLTGAKPKVEHVALAEPLAPGKRWSGSVTFARVNPTANGNLPKVQVELVECAW